MVRFLSTILGDRFIGRNIYIELQNGEAIEGILEEVTNYEIGIRSKGKPVIVFKHAVKRIKVKENEIRGVLTDCCEESHILNTEYQGMEIEVCFLDRSRMKGRLVRVARYEIAVASDDSAYIISKGSIAYIVIMSE